jgi:hypothetical protein
VTYSPVVQASYFIRLGSERDRQLAIPNPIKHARSVGFPILISAIVVGSCSSHATTAVSPSGAGLVERARAIHSRVVTIDTHKDIPDNFGTAEADPKTMPSQVNLDKMKSRRLRHGFFASTSAKGRAPTAATRGQKDAR